MAWPKNGKGKGNTNWKGDNVSYRGLHARVVRWWGKASICEECDTKESKVYDWANLSGKYLSEREDWKQLCRSCHQKLDYKLGVRHARKA